MCAIFKKKKKKKNIYLQRFALLKSVLISLRGVRGKQRKDAALPTSAVDFGLIPECDAYEAY